jgi:hypothetical protein
VLSVKTNLLLEASLANRNSSSSIRVDSSEQLNSNLNRPQEDSSEQLNNLNRPQEDSSEQLNSNLNRPQEDFLEPRINRLNKLLVDSSDRPKRSPNPPQVDYLDRLRRLNQVQVDCLDRLQADYSGQLKRNPSKLVPSLALLSSSSSSHSKRAFLALARPLHYNLRLHYPLARSVL